MSTSELRRGPGWWLDLEGQWKPPQAWPESSPPLPGWTRSTDGTWQPPVGATVTDEVDEETVQVSDGIDLGAVEVDTDTTPPARPIPETASQTPVPEATPATEPTLQFSGTEAVFEADVDEERVRNRMILAVVIAAILAAMLGFGVVVLLSAF